MINKRQIIKICGVFGVLVLVAIGISVLIWQLSFRSVNFILSSKVESIIIYPHSEDYGERKELATLSESKIVRLQDGEYEILPSGKNVDTAIINVSINKDSREVKIEPGFSGEHLEKLLEQERETAQQVIKDRYAKIIDQYIIDNGQLLLDGSWYITVIQHIPTVRGEAIPDMDIYRVILNKVDGKWQIVAKPSLVFKYNDYPNIPKVVVNKANMFSGN